MAGASDWVDGALARALNQRSELGILLDPLADRLYIAATLLGLALRGIIPWWLVGILVAARAVPADPAARIRRTGRLALPVTYVGKAATFCLLWGFPLLLLGDLPTFGTARRRLRLGLRALGDLPVLVVGHTLRTAGVRTPRAGVTTG